MSGRSDPVLARRRLLDLSDNPRPSIDYLVDAEFSLGPLLGETSPTFRLAYVPDQLLLDLQAPTSYGQALLQQSFAGLEDLVAVVFEDINDQLVPRWLRLTVGIPGYRLTFEDRQPNWNSPHLLPPRDS